MELSVLLAFVIAWSPALTALGSHSEAFHIRIFAFACGARDLAELGTWRSSTPSFSLCFRQKSSKMSIYSMNSRTPPQLILGGGVREFIE